MPGDHDRPGDRDTSSEQDRPTDLDRTVDLPSAADPPDTPRPDPPPDSGDLFEDPSDPHAHIGHAPTAPPTDVPVPAAAVAGSASHPDRIGPFAIKGVLGQGGMGVVYRAEQESPRREVALKVVRPGYASPEILRRFAHESHILGKLQHPGIAQVFQAGTADTGGGPQPFFAMELVSGPTLAEHIERDNPPLEDRLRLMVQICDAVQHAHTKGVIHRDLKPANVIITPASTASPGGSVGSGSGVRALAGVQPKVLDFGVARATDADMQAATIQTTAGQLVGTLPYMSPEQVAADPDALDTRSDVYTLGVMLYELVSGELPRKVQGMGIAEAARAIAEQDAPLLGSIDRRWRGDLETIADRALAREPDRRYQSAADLAAEIERFLSDVPIEARPASTLYTLRKFARRNRVLVAAGTAAGVMLALGVAGTVWQAVRASNEAELARQAESRAEAEAVVARQAEARAVAINDFLVTELLGAANPAVAQGRDISVGQVLTQASERVGPALADEPELEASVRGVLGEVFMNLADGDNARAEFDRVADITDQVFGPTDERTLSARHAVAALDARMGLLNESRARLEELLPAMRQHLGEEHVETVNATASYGRVLLELGDLAEAERLLAETATKLETLLGPDDIQTLTTLNNYATALKDQRKLAEAEAIDRDLLERRLRVFGDRHPDTLVSMNNLAALLQLQGKSAEAEALFERTLAGRREVFGDQHPATLTTMNNMGDAAIRSGRFAEAERWLTEAIAGYEAVFGDRHPSLLTARNNLAYAYEELGRDAEAEPLYRAVLATRLEVLGETRPETLTSMNNLGVLLQRTGRPAEAAEMLARAVRVSEEALGATHPYTAIFENNYGDCLTDLGRRAEAIAAIERSGAVLEQVGGTDHERSIRSRERLARAEALAE